MPDKKPVTKTRLITRDAVPSDKPMIMEHIRRVWEPRVYAEKEKTWNWLFLDNPFITGSMASVYIITDEEKVYGLIVSTPVDILVKNSEMRISWIGSTSIDEEYRNKLIALRLSLRLRQKKNYGVGFPIERVIPLYRKWANEETLVHIVGKFCLMSKFLRLDDILPFKMVLWPANLVFNLVERIHTWFAGGVIHRDYRFEQVDRFDKEYDDWFEGIRPGYSDMIIQKVDAEFLNWRYLDAPSRSYSAFIVRGKKTVYAVSAFWRSMCSRVSL